ncbi:MAG: hypothetical protein S4CHLAM37_03400 [Chlamydiia bacterium]|nr:hypothetical protein [Chlamydiia bacterium]
MEIPQVDGVIESSYPIEPIAEDIMNSPSLAHLIKTTAKLCRDTDKDLSAASEYSDPVSNRIKEYVLSFD